MSHSCPLQILEHQGLTLNINLLNNLTQKITKELPRNPEDLFQWMVRLYQQKEEMLDAYYKTGMTPD